MTKLFLILFFISSIASAHSSRAVFCSTKDPVVLQVPFNDAMTVEFPEKPKTSLPGNNSFDFKFINNDLAIASLSPNARSNLFVYLGSDKCVFKLVATTSNNSDTIVKVKYPKGSTVEASYVK